MNNLSRIIQRILEPMLIDSFLASDRENQMSQMKRLPGNPPAFTSRFDSRCLLCGRIFYKQMRLKCSKCRGRCRIMLPDELALSVRRPT